MAGNGLELARGIIRKHEGFRTGTYWDVNAWRLGYGTDTITDANGNVRRVKKGDTVTRADAERDLARRVNDFYRGARATIGAEAFDKLSPTAQASLTSVAYNYGSLNNLRGVVKAARSGDVNRVASAIRGLSGHNKGVNAKRRGEEAAFALGGGAAPSAGGVSVAQAASLPNQNQPNESGLNVAQSIEVQPVAVDPLQTAEVAPLQMAETKQQVDPMIVQAERDRAFSQMQDSLKIQPLVFEPTESPKSQYRDQLAAAFGEYPDMSGQIPNEIDTLIQSIYDAV